MSRNHQMEPSLSVVMIGSRDEDHRSRSLRQWDRGIVPGDVNSSGHAAGVVHGALEKGVGVRHHHNLFVGGTWQDSVDILAWHVLAIRDVELEAELHLLAGCEQVA